MKLFYIRKFLSYYYLMKKTIIVFAILIIVGGIVYFYKSPKKSSEGNNLPIFSTNQNDLENSSFEINGKIITLKNGVSEIEVAPSSASKIITRYFGNESTGDLNFDGIPDTAFLVTQDTGGSGTFYYAVVALKTKDGYKYTNAFFIGDRIAPQNTRIISNELDVNYAERKPGEPMTTQPSIGAVKILKVTPKGVLNGLMQ
jgi:hypothetical protein